MLEPLHNIITTLSDFLYQPFIVPFLLVAAGLYLSIRMGFPQIRLFIETLRVLNEKPVQGSGISSFGALMVSTASRVGTGNIVGVSSAICMGGPGAVFWMWLIAIIGSASAFVESTLAQIYKREDLVTGHSYGGPSYYIQTALGQRWLGIIFSVFILLTYLVGYNLLASYNVQTSFSGYGFYSETKTPIIVGAMLAILFALCVFGGARKLTKITSYLVPIMSITYIVVAIGVIVFNFTNVPAMFATILKDAFSFEAGAGGFAGSCIMYGIKRGLYSNEAGMGSAPNASASASVSHPVKQGLVQSLSVFIDTIVICSATALMCLSTDVAPSSEISGIPYVQASLHSVFGELGPMFITVAILLFGFTTLIGNYYYTEGCLRFIINRRPGKIIMTVFRIIASIIVFAGALASAGFAWDSADLCQALMVVVNIPCILILSPIAIKALRNYTEQRKQGKEPVYFAKECGVNQDTDFWNRLE
ncbi:MAG: alanine:cation symporter family protein [Fibrobacter sp.]|nr:alanine:cation symporter family protein [Fibrobacter sp.]